LWVALYFQSPVRSIHDCVYLYQTKHPYQGGPSAESWQMEIRSARDNTRVMIVPWGPLPQSRIVADFGYFNKIMPKGTVPDVPDGIYRVALLHNGKRCSYVAQFVIDSGFDPRKEPLFRVVTLPPWPDGSQMPLVAVQVTGPTPEDPGLTTYVVETYVSLIVDGREHRWGSPPSWSGSVRPLHSGERVMVWPLLNTNSEPYEPTSFVLYPAIEPETSHKFSVKVGNYQSKPMKLEYMGRLEEAWDAPGH
jgi:hypothetical protein